MEKRGRAEAEKQNRGWFKDSLHAQDITIVGEEANDDFMSSTDLKDLMKQYSNQDEARG